MSNSNQPVQSGFWQRYKAPVLLTVVGGAIDTIGFIALLGFFTAHVTGNLVMAGGSLVGGGDGLWIKLAALPVFILTVMITKRFIDRTDDHKPILSYLLLAEAAFLVAFMIAGLCFRPFNDAGSLTVAMTGGFGLIALAIRNTASRTVIKHMSPTVLIVSGGNFHAQPIAFAADNIALAIAEIGALSERRMALLLDANMSALPPFLVKDAGVNSGFMIAQVTAAALASENKSLAHPASVDSLPTSANQEDHVSMATFAARRLTDMNLNTRYVVAIELLAACQGIELRRPLQSNEALEGYWSDVRLVAAYWDHDRYFQPDLEAISELIQANTFGDWANDYIASAS